MTDHSQPVRLSRRALLAAGAGAALAACTGSAEPDTSDSPSSSTNGTDPSTTEQGTSTAPPTTARLEPVAAPAYSGSDPFGLGVASGDPDADSVVLWTRLVAGTPGELGGDDREVAWDLSRTEDFDDLVVSGTALAPEQYAHSVHLTIGALEANTWYWYRFRIGDHTSPVGRTRTTPPAGSTEELRFGFSSCQNWELGAYAAHRHAAERDDLDLFVWLGDYIYENGPSPAGVVTEAAGERVHDSDEVTDLAGYRDRYALYRSDPHLQANHAARPWIVTWDDHEVDNNYAGPVGQGDPPTDEFLVRQRAAHQAWWEHMPVRIDPPDGGLLTIYRTIRWGDLLDLHMLDGRQYRDPQPTDGEQVLLPGVGDVGVRTIGPTALDPDHSMLGATQEDWLVDEIESSSAVWTVLGNQVYMHGINALPGAEPAINTDTWDGYFGNRRRLLQRIDEASAGDLVVITGDFHASTVAGLRDDPFDLTRPVLGTEFMAPAISSQFPAQLRDLAPLALAINPQVVDFSTANGLMVCTVTPDSWVAERIDLADPRDEDSPAIVGVRHTLGVGTPGELTTEITEPAAAS